MSWPDSDTHHIQETVYRGKGADTNVTLTGKTYVTNTQEDEYSLSLRLCCLQTQNTHTHTHTYAQMTA